MDHPAHHAHLEGLMRGLARAAPATMGGFARLHEASLAEGALGREVKELMALAISIAVHCEGCVTYHVHDALAAGATPEQVAEAVAVAVMMGGGPATIYGAEALEALAQFRPAA
jgi:AhpD family alkylhydroperoxidase